MLRARGFPPAHVRTLRAPCRQPAAAFQASWAQAATSGGVFVPDSRPAGYVFDHWIGHC